MNRLIKGLTSAHFNVEAQEEPRRKWKAKRRAEEETQQSAGPKEAGVRRFKFDVFVSYSVLDDLSPSGHRHGWVSTFIDNLEIELTTQLGRHASIWYDDSMTGERVFDETTKSALRVSAVLIAILTPSYRQSPYCAKEREWFAREVGDQRRLLQVRPMNIPHEQWPIELQGCTGFDFFSLRAHDRLGIPLDSTDPAFKEELRKVVVAILPLLQSL
jgi:hypothetical protein